MNRNNVLTFKFRSELVFNDIVTFCEWSCQFLRLFF